MKQPTVNVSIYLIAIAGLYVSLLLSDNQIWPVFGAVAN